MASDNMILIMVDECGEESEYERYHLGLDLDEDELDIWKERKIEKARDVYPEARGFYWEDRRNWGALFRAMGPFDDVEFIGGATFLNGEWWPGEEPEEWDEDEDEDE